MNDLFAFVPQFLGLSQKSLGVLPRKWDRARRDNALDDRPDPDGRETESDAKALHQCALEV